MKEFAQPFFQVLLEIIFVNQELVQRTVETVIIDVFLRYTQKVWHGTLAVELFRNVKFT